MSFQTISESFFISKHDFEPAYMALHRSGELRQRAEAALERLRDCHVCPRDCGVDRMANKKAACKTGRYAFVASYFAHFGEEDCLRGWNGSGTIFFSWCNLRCVFCFHPDTLIPTDQGLRRIADLFEAGRDERELHHGHVRFMNGQVQAVTRSGKFATVAKAFRHHFVGELVKLQPLDCPPLLLTPNHKVFAVHRSDPNGVVKVRADHLTQDHYLLIPRRAPVELLTGLRPSRWLPAPDYFQLPLHKIERLPYDGPVYNLEMDDPDHSYLAPFVAVSNCQNFDISQDGDGGEARPELLAQMMLRLQAQGCHNINFVTPEHVVPQVLEALVIAVERGLRLPIVYNTSAYDSLDSLHLLDGIVDIYMPDFKFWDPALALRYLKAKDYPDAARNAITEMHRQVGVLKMDEDGLAKRGVLVRHLVMPGAIAGTAEIMRFLASLSKDTYVNIMAQYYPAGKVSDQKYEEINRRITSAEYIEAVRLAKEAGLWRFDERRAHMRFRLVEL